MRNRKPVLGILAATVILGLVAGTAGAAVLHVANNGTDSATCGAVATPCRSMSQAIANAAANDRIVVGPGRYGDLNGNGILGEPGEETGGACFCLVAVSKPLTLESEEGAGATILDAGVGPTFDGFGIPIAGSGSVIGKPGKGFTVSGGFNGFVTENAPPFVSELTISGNIGVNSAEPAFLLHASNTSRFVVTDNLAIRSGGGFGVYAGMGHTFKNNAAIGNQGEGFGVAGGSGQIFVGNVAIANAGNGFHFTASTGVSLRGNSVIGNKGAGMVFQDAATATLRQNNFYGNLTGNCGLSAGGPGTSVDAANNYWGAATGPGPDPADDNCGSAVFAPFATKEFPISTTWK